MSIIKIYALRNSVHTLANEGHEIYAERFASGQFQKEKTAKGQFRVIKPLNMSESVSARMQELSA